MEYPYNFPITLNGCAHYMREVGTDNSINFNFKKGLTGKPWVEVLRYRPGDTFQTPEVVGFFYPTKFSYMHSFSITENYAVFLFYPVKIDAKVVLLIFITHCNQSYFRNSLTPTSMLLRCSRVEM